MSKVFPTIELEQELWKNAPLVGGVDEVGRGAWAGPVMVGICWVRPQDGPPPPGLADSKLLTPARREALVEPVKQWVSGWGIGQCSASEIDRVGLARALKLAAWRALALSVEDLERNGHPTEHLALVVDGPHNYLALGSDLFDTAPQELQRVAEFVCRIKADQHCASVAAASVLAKVYRDTLMTQLPDPGYDWARNKGYPSPRHRHAIRQQGLGPYHRRSWKLPDASKDGTMGG